MKNNEIFTEFDRKKRTRIYMSEKEEVFRVFWRFELENVDGDIAKAPNDYNLRDEWRNWIAYILFGKRENKDFYKEIIMITPELDLLLQEIILQRDGEDLEKKYASQIAAAEDEFIERMRLGEYDD